MKSVVITGASTGIGRAIAEHLAAQKWIVFAGVRKEADGAPLVEAHDNIRPILLDVTKPDQVAAAVQSVTETLGERTLDGLVNNAGIAIMGPLALQPMEEIRAHFDVNVFGAVATTQAFAPLLGMDRDRIGSPGRIINITSNGGKVASPILGAYTATKHAMESITDTLRRELMLYDIDAIAVGPGAVKTPIWDKADEKAANAPYQDTEWAEPVRKFSEISMSSGQDGLDAHVIAKVVEKALTVSKPKARYAPVQNKLTNFTILTRLPKRWVDRIFASRLGLNRQTA
ncbi:MAG: SDR family NAD(P)-dependent oxidoreductase [Pseudomonadota bacterium]